MFGVLGKSYKRLLGGTLMTLEVTDLNDATVPGVYGFTITSSNTPNNYGACLVILMQYNRIYQLAYGFSTVNECNTYFRMYANAWTEWKKVATV